MMQVNPGWNGVPVRVAEAGEGSREELFLMEDETIVFGKPVLTIMGDSHTVRIDKPILGAKTGRPLENFTRLEVPGSSEVHWVRVRVDPARRQIFGFNWVYLEGVRFIRLGQTELTISSKTGLPV